MGKLLFVDPVAGAAGDMLCAALLDAGGDLDLLRNQLQDALGPGGVTGYRLALDRVMRGPLSALHFDVQPTAPAPAPAAPAAPAAPDEDAHAHDHDHGHGHAHSHSHSHGDMWAGQPHRTWKHIRGVLAAGALPPRAAERVHATFARLAQAEGRVHGQPPDDVEFHEVGAVDSLVDVVGCCLLLEQLDVDEIVVGALPVGSGTVMTAHGRVPLPAPATALLLEGADLRPGAPGLEQVTPTGAALLTSLGTSGVQPAMRLERVGLGAGTRDTADLPNVVRVFLGHRTPTTSATAPQTDHVIVLTTQVDDMSGEHVPGVLAAVLDAGALDVTATPVLMKKGRTGLRIEALCAPDAVSATEGALLKHSTTFGVRRHPCERTILTRRFDTVATPWGPVSVKIGAHEGQVLQIAPEYEDTARLARTAGVAERLVHAAALSAWMQAFGSDPETA